MLFYMSKIILSIFLLVLKCDSVWVTYTQFTGSIPTYIYPLNLNAGDRLQGRLSWANSAYDLDLYLYQSSTDLLVRSNYLIRCFSDANKPQNLYYNITASGTYYLRPDLYTSTPSPYKLEIFINGQLFKTDYSTLYTVSSGLGNFNFQITSACVVNIIYDGPIYNISLYQPGAAIPSGIPIASNKTNTNPKTLASSLNLLGNWSIIIYHKITSAFSITPFKITVQTQKGIDQCINYCSNIANTMGLVASTNSTCFCAIGYQWVGASSSCQVICSPGYIYNTTTNTCQFKSCGISFCVNCPISATVCFNCSLGYQVINSTCQAVCGDLIVAGSQLCDDGNNIDGDGCSTSCKIECPPGYYFNYITNVCQACKYTCATCSDGVTCDTCSVVSHRFINFSQCDPISGYFDNLTATAVPCISPCSTCISASTCITCISGYYFDGLNCLIIINPTPNNNSIVPTTNISTIGQNRIDELLTLLGKTLSFSQIRVLPNVLRCFSLILDDLWYYRFHRVTYPETARFFMDKVNIINDLRLSPWLLDSINYLQFNQIDLGISYQIQYNQFISQHQNNPDSIYFINSSQEIFFGNFITNIAYFILIKLAQLAFYLLRNYWVFIKKVYIMLRNSNRWWTIVTILIQASLAKLVFNCSVQSLILSSLNYYNKLNMVFSMMLLFSALVYSCCFYPIIYYFQKKKSAQTLLAHTRYTWRGFYIQSFCFMARTTTRGFIHGFFIQSYKYQILSLAISDFFFAGMCVYFYRSFYHKVLLLSIILYNILFLALDTIFYFHLLNAEYFAGINYEEMAFWMICAIFAASLLIIFSIIGFNIYILCCKMKDQDSDLISEINRDYKENLRKNFGITKNNVVKIGMKLKNNQLRSEQNLNNLQFKKQGQKKQKGIKVKPINFANSKKNIRLHILTKTNNERMIQNDKFDTPQLFIPVSRGKTQIYATKPKFKKTKKLQTNLSR